MSKGQIFLTGGSGFLGSHIAAEALRAGYSVKATFRSEAKAQHFERIFSSDRVQTCIVKDITAPEAYRGLMDNSDFVIHAASPFTFAIKDIQQDLIKPAVQGTARILEAISDCPKLKRLILTSSFAAVVDPTLGPRAGYTYTEKEWNPMTPEKALENQLFGYQASKTFAERSAWDFIQDKSKQRHLSLVSFCPPMILGPPHPVSGITASASNESIAQLLNAIRSEEAPATRMPVFVDVRDCARAHIIALDTVKVPSSERFVLCGGKFTWQAAREIYETGEATDASLAAAAGFYSINAEKAEKMLGLEWTSFQSTVQDCFASIDTLPARETRI